MLQSLKSPLRVQVHLKLRRSGFDFEPHKSGVTWLNFCNPFLHPWAFFGSHRQSTIPEVLSQLLCSCSSGEISISHVPTSGSHAVKLFALEREVSDGRWTHCSLDRLHFLPENLNGVVHMVSACWTFNLQDGVALLVCGRR